MAARELRAKRAELELCVNGCGPRTHGIRCLACSLVHKHGRAIASTMPEWKEARQAAAERKEAARALVDGNP